MTTRHAKRTLGLLAVGGLAFLAPATSLKLEMHNDGSAAAAGQAQSSSRNTGDLLPPLTVPRDCWGSGRSSAGAYAQPAQPMQRRESRQERLSRMERTKAKLRQAHQMVGAESPRSVAWSATAHEPDSSEGLGSADAHLRDAGKRDGEQLRVVTDTPVPVESPVASPSDSYADELFEPYHGEDDKDVRQTPRDGGDAARVAAQLDTKPTGVPDGEAAASARASGSPGRGDAGQFRRALTPAPSALLPALLPHSSSAAARLAEKPRGITFPVGSTERALAATRRRKPAGSFLAPLVEGGRLPNRDQRAAVGDRRRQTRLYRGLRTDSRVRRRQRGVQLA